VICVEDFVIPTYRRSDGKSGYGNPARSVSIGILPVVLARSATSLGLRLVKARKLSYRKDDGLKKNPHSAVRRASAQGEPKSTLFLPIIVSVRRFVVAETTIMAARSIRSRIFYQPERR
jgi:hypothetical protein